MCGAEFPLRAYACVGTVFTRSFLFSCFPILIDALVDPLEFKGKYGFWSLQMRSEPVLHVYPVLPIV